MLFRRKSCLFVIVRTTLQREKSNAEGNPNPSAVLPAGQRSMASPEALSAEPMPDTGRTVGERVVSCGIVLLDVDGRVLLAHATETTHWDIPKGHGEAGETPEVTALREMVEETGIALQPGRLKDLGLFVYRRNKDLHLFAARAGKDEIDLAQCVCTSWFPRRQDGRMIPEMDAYRWTAPDEVDQYASRSLTRLFPTLLSLPELHRSL
jgi:8-oxo-dGTP pyrophosphatase MutT (NUDIX family)